MIMKVIKKTVYETVWLMRHKIQRSREQIDSPTFQGIVGIVLHYLRAYHKFLCSRYCDDLYHNDDAYTNNPLFFSLRSKTEKKDTKHLGLMEMREDWRAVFYYWSLIARMKVHGIQYREKKSRLVKPKSVRLSHSLFNGDLVYYVPSPTLNLRSAKSDEAIKAFIIRFFTIASDMDPASIHAQIDPYFIVVGDGIGKRGKRRKYITPTDREFELFTTIVDLQTSMGVEFRVNRIFLARLYEADTLDKFCDVWIENLKEEGLYKHITADISKTGGL